VDSEKVVVAAKNAGLHDLILHLPEGYDTPLGPGGRGLASTQPAGPAPTITYSKAVPSTFI
jgi:ABC-type protease/lipase transport system fused ATPase/permease subunit